MLRINNNRNKFIIKESIFFLFLLVIFSISIFFCPEIYENVWCKSSVYLLGIIVLYSYYCMLFRWKVIALSSEGILEELYKITQKHPYKVKNIVSWQNVKRVHLIKKHCYGKIQPCSVMIEYVNAKRQIDFYNIKTDGMYFFNYKGQEYDSRLVDYLNELSSKYSFKIMYEE